MGSVNSHIPGFALNIIPINRPSQLANYPINKDVVARQSRAISLLLSGGGPDARFTTALVVVSVTRQVTPATHSAT